MQAVLRAKGFFGEHHAMNQQEAAAALSVWVALESPTSHPAGLNGMMDLVQKDVAGLPIAVERIPGRDGLGDMVLLRAGLDNGQPGVAVMSHLDTVHPVGTSASILRYVSMPDDSHHIICQGESRFSIVTCTRPSM